MRKLTPLRLLLGAVGLAIGIVGILALREATLSSGQRLFFGPPAGTGEGPATIR